MQVKEAIYNRRAIKQFDADHRMPPRDRDPVGSRSRHRPAVGPRVHAAPLPAAVPLVGESLRAGHQPMAAVLLGIDSRV